MASALNSQSASRRRSSPTDPTDRRQRAFARARRHSVLVRVLKVALPVVAVVSTGVLFLSPAMLVSMVHPGLNASVGAVQITTDQLRMVNPRFDGFTAGKGHYVVTANAAVQMLDKADLMNLEIVHGHLIQVDQSWTDITSKSGVYQTKTKALRLADGIVITTSALARAELDHADIDVDKKLVTSDASVTMTMPNGTLKGRGLIVDNAARRLLLKDAVTAHLLPPKHAVADPAAPAPVVAATSLSMTPAMSDAPVDITSTQLEILDNAKTATFSGAVKAVQAGMVLHSDKMEVGYASQAGATPTALTSAGPGAQNLSYVTASSNVLITTPDGRKATCGQSRFDQKANTMTLQGDVVLSQGASQLHGDSVVYDMAAKKTHVSARNRVSGHFESDAVALRPASGALPAATGLSGLGAAHGATDVSADSLEIANAENLAVFQGTVIVTQQGNKLTGDRLDVDMARHHMTMTGPGRVSGVFEASAPGAAAPGRIAKVASAAPVGQDVGHSFAGMSASNGQPTNIESDSLSVEDDKGQATFNGSVVVVRGGHRITASQLTVDYGHAGAGDAAQEGSQLKRIRAKDHVIVHTPDNQVATSDWLLYDPAHNQLTMGGNVTVSQGANVVHGEKLVVDLASGESHFETRADETAAQSPATGAPASPPGRIQVLIDVGHGSQGGLRQIGGPPVAGAHAAAKPAQKEDMSASDVMVAPTEPQ